MKINGQYYRSIWHTEDGMVDIIDQTELPHGFQIRRITDAEEAAEAIKNMYVRGAPLIGAMAAYGMCLALRRDPSNKALLDVSEMMMATRPTAINLKWAVSEMCKTLVEFSGKQRVIEAYKKAAAICDLDVAMNEAIGKNGLKIIEEIAQRKNGEPVNILTHCNAGWLATVDWGTATAPIYMAHDKGINVHVWVDETRPRNQGALTAFELGQHGVPHHYITDNAGGHLMQRGQVDMVIVGTDRTTANGDVCNKIGTYLKALAAHDNGVPFYVALPSTTLDFTLDSGKSVPIEERAGSEVAFIGGMISQGRVGQVLVPPSGTPVVNPSFDVTPAKYVTGLITERGTIPATREALADMFPERVKAIKRAG